MRCAILQTTPTFGAVAANLDDLARLMGRLEDVDLVVAPEVANTGYDIARLEVEGHDLAEPLDGPSVARLAALAAEHTTTLVCGVLEAADGQMYDTVVTCRPDGSVTPYRKTHLYPNEQPVFTPGRRLQTVDTGWGRVGPLICFEHAFPEIATTLALRGAQVLAIPSAVPDGYEHLLALRSRARAQDNQVFVVAANLASDGFCGRSLIVDPRGDVLANGGPDEAVLVATIDLAEIEAERGREPSLQLRRPDLYGA